MASTVKEHQGIEIRKPMKSGAMGVTRDAYNEREDAVDQFEGPEGERSDSKWHASDDFRMGTSPITSERGTEIVSRRGIQDKGETTSGDRSELPKDSSSERSPRVMKKIGRRKVDVSWDDSEEAKANGRGKRSREDGCRDRSTCKERGVHQGDSDDGSNGLVRRGEDSRGYGLPGGSGGAEKRGEFEGVVRSFNRLKTARTEDDERILTKTESGREETENDFRLSGRCRADKGKDYCVEKPAIDSREMAETGIFSGKGRGEVDRDVGGKQQDNSGRESFEGKELVPDTLGRLGRRNRGNVETLGKLEPGHVRDGDRDESEDGGKATGRHRGEKTLKELRVSYGKEGVHGDWADIEWGWIASADFEQKNVSSRIGLEKNRLRYIETCRGHEMCNEYPWDRERRREWEGSVCSIDRMRNGYGEGDKKTRELLEDVDRSRERIEIDGCISDKEVLDRERIEDLSGSNGTVVVNEGYVGSAASVPLQLSSCPVRGISSGALCFPRAGGDSSAGHDADCNGPVEEERVRLADGGHTDKRERYSNEEVPPPGLEQVLGPNPGTVVSNDVGMVFNVHGGRGRSKCSLSNRSRGAMIVHDGRPLVVQSLGTGLMTRGFQPGAKGVRGRGPAKAVRGGGRDGHRGNLAVISQLRPGRAGPLFGQLGPPGPISGLGPGIMGPGAFPLPPFGGRLGWNGGGDMGMMNVPSGPVAGPPRFVPGMGPGPPSLGPNMFFNAPLRGSPSAISLGSMAGRNLPFGCRPLPGDRVQFEGRCISRGGGPAGLAGRGPSRGEQNDYSQHFVDTGLRPQNFIRDVELADRFEEYPKLKELIARKDKLISERATPPMYLQCDLRNIELHPEVFGTKFDVILVDPPWEEYVRRAPGVGDSMEWWSHADIQSLRIEAISDTPAFIFLWVGDAEGLDQGRLCLKKWGFRRCEDICWVKTNRENPTPALRHDANTVLQHSKEHCLMGIKGTVRRSTDGHIIHANVDTDIIISEEAEYGSTAKPEELYHIIEHFAQGQRRIELFGEDHNIRAGWVTVGKGLSSSNFSPQAYAKYFFDCEGKLWQGGRGNPPLDSPHLVGTTSEIESLRPKSPPPRALQQPQSHTANAIQTSGPNANSKRVFTSQCAFPNVPLIPSSAPVGVHTSLVPVETGRVESGGSAISHSQILKPVENVIHCDTKPSGTQEGVGPAKATNEEQSLGMNL